jgi:hypothetical protein
VESLFRFLVKYEIWVYLALALGAIFAIRALWNAWSEWHKSVYGLEKELSLQRLRISGAAVILLLMIGMGQFCLVSFVVPFLPGSTFLLTPTADLLQTPVSTLEAGVPAPETSIPIQPGENGCKPGHLIITSPTPGQEIGGKITLIGSVDVENYGYFKYEFAPQGSEQWTTIGAGNDIRQNKELGAWDPSVLVPGDYQLRLVVTDNLGKLLPPCIVPVRVIAPTATP